MTEGADTTTTDYSGKFIFQNNILQFIFQPESDVEHDGMDCYDYGARFYEPALGRFHSIDPLAETYSNLSPYNYVANNPLSFIDPNGMYIDEYKVDINTGDVSKVSDLGNSEGIDIYHVGESQDNGTAFTYDGTIVVERNSEGGNVNLIRIQEDFKGTVSAMHIPQDEISGVVLEPAGESTTTANQDKRIPEGSFDLITSKDRPGFDADKLKYPDSFVLYNSDVSMDRSITLHSGNFHDNTEGCPMPATSFSVGKAGDYKVTPARVGYLRTSSSGVKTNEVNGFIQSKGVNNVKVNIYNAIK